jgi:hypothetical protein
MTLGASMRTYDEALEALATFLDGFRVDPGTIGYEGTECLSSRPDAFSLSILGLGVAGHDFERLAHALNKLDPADTSVEDRRRLRDGAFLCDLATLVLAGYFDLDAAGRPNRDEAGHWRRGSLG